jgi:hypothetical protein
MTKRIPSIESSMGNIRSQGTAQFQLKEKDSEKAPSRNSSIMLIPQAVKPSDRLVKKS